MEATSAVGISDAILFASHESLASALALIEELSLFRLIWSKGSELVEKTSNVFSHGTWIADSDHFHDVLTTKAKQFDSTSPGELLLRTLGSLQKLVDASPRDLRVGLDLSEVAEDICTCTVRILRENTKGEKEDKKFAGSTIADMIKFEMTRIFGGLNIRLEELSMSQQQSLVEAIRKFLEGLPPDQQRFILEKLGASEISEAAIRQAIASGTMWAAFAAAVQVFGFSFYMIAAQLLAIVSLHLLPFGAYMALSSTIAVLSSAWMLPIFVGFGIWYYSRSNQNLRKSMVPLIVTSLCLSGMEVQARTPGRLDIIGTEVLDLWRNAREDRDEKRRQAEKGGQIKSEIQSRLQRLQAELIEVDGHPFQIKCVADSSAVLEHLHRYPDIPVIVNSEVGSQMADHVGVYADPELHHDAVRHLTEETLARGQEMTDFDIPWLTLGVSGAANLYYMLKNDTDFAAMLTCTATDTIGRTAGGFAGKYAGAGAGALLFGPAGVIVVGLLGAIGGSMIGRRVVATGRTLLVDSEETAVRVSARRVAEAAINAMPEKLEAWREKQELVAECLSGAEGNRIKVQKSMIYKTTEHIEYWATKRTELQQFAHSADGIPVDLVERVLLLLRRAGIHPHHVQAPMRELSDKLQIFIDACKRLRLSPS